MKKLDLVLENIRDEYMINVLEEGTSTELEALKTKKFLNESIASIRGILIQEGVMPAVQDHLKNNWKKYLAGGATAAMMASDPAQDAIQNVAGGLSDAVSSDNSFGTNVGNVAGLVGGSVEGAVGRGMDAAGELYDKADKALGGNLPGGQTPVENTQAAVQANNYDTNTTSQDALRNAKANLSALQAGNTSIPSSSDNTPYVGTGSQDMDRLNASLAQGHINQNEYNQLAANRRG